jgi:flavine halogenase
MYNQKQKDSASQSVFPTTNASNLANSSTVNRYLSDIGLAPGVLELLRLNARLVEGSVKSASDFSYSAKNYAGDKWRIVGDAGGKYEF